MLSHNLKTKNYVFIEAFAEPFFLIHGAGTIFKKSLERELMPVPFFF